MGGRRGRQEVGGDREGERREGGTRGVHASGEAEGNADTLAWFHYRCVGVVKNHSEISLNRTGN